MKIISLGNSRISAEIDFDAGLIYDIEFSEDEIAITYSPIAFSAAFEFSISSVLIVAVVTDKTIHADCSLFIEEEGSIPPAILTGDGVADCALCLTDKEKLELLIAVLKKSQQV